MHSRVIDALIYNYFLIYIARSLLYILFLGKYHSTYVVEIEYTKQLFFVLYVYFLTNSILGIRTVHWAVSGVFRGCWN